MTDTEFEFHVNTMREMEKAEGYGPATQYYLDHLVDACAERARARADDLPERVDLLVCPVGMSARTAVLACKILRPARLVLITSDAAHAVVNVIHRSVVSADGLQPADVVPRSCDSTDPRSVYLIVRDEVANTKRRLGRDITAYIDITGGRKVMTASCALAAWQLDLFLSYVDGSYEADLGHTGPGHDRIILLDNPMSIFGEQEMKVAAEAFAGGNFDAAQSRFDELAGRLVHPETARFMAALSALYRAWFALDRAAIEAAVTQVQEMIRPVRRYLKAELVQTVRAQVDVLTELAREDRRALLLTFRILDDHYRSIRRHDFAALFAYRTIEQCLVTHLDVRYGFQTKSPDLTKLAADPDALIRDYRRIVAAARGRPFSGRPGRQNLGLFQIAALLQAVRDPLAAAAGLGTPADLYHLERLAHARHDSVLAHGHAFIGPGLSGDLHAKAATVLAAYWAEHHREEDLDEVLARLAIAPVEL